MLKLKLVTGTEIEVTHTEAFISVIVLINQRKHTRSYSEVNHRE